MSSEEDLTIAGKRMDTNNATATVTELARFRNKNLVVVEETSILLIGKLMMP
jgi:hypothetical protein